MDRVIVTAVERAKGAFETLTHLPWRPGLGRHPSRGESSAAPALAALLPPRQSILVTGGTGFIGARLCEILIEEGHQVTVLTRDPRNGRRFRGRVTRSRACCCLSSWDSAAAWGAAGNGCRGSIATTSSA